MGFDRPDEDDAAATGHTADLVSPADQNQGPDSADPAERKDQASLATETRDRADYYAELRATVAAAARAAEQVPDASDSWDGAADWFARKWAEHERRWPSPERSAAIPPDQPSPACRDGGRLLNAAADNEVERSYERIREIERDIITPIMRRIEVAEPGRELVGLDHRLKGEDRLKQKVAVALHEQPQLTADQALATVKDPIRYTFRYGEEHYTDGVYADTRRLETAEFELVERRNSWTHQEYRGINTRWREPGTGQLFEVQFHTEISFEAKQLTHAAYERLRDPATTDTEAGEMRQFQRGLCAKVPVPPGAPDIPDYP